MSSSDIADYIVRKATKSEVRNLYDITTQTEPASSEDGPDIFAQLMRLESPKQVLHYRICLQDEEIMSFLRQHPEIDMLTFFTCVMTHELLHMERCLTGKADFATVNYDEEILVDNLTRLLLAKHPVTGMGHVLNLLDKLTAPPLYNLRTIIDQGGIIDAYL